MNRRRIAPAILIFATLSLGAVSLIRLQANAPRGVVPMPDRIYPLNQTPGIALKYAAEGTIKAQLEALRNHDIWTAQSYESRLVMQYVNSREEFLIYATGGYPEVAYFDRITFGHAMTDVMNQRVMVPSTITGADRMNVHITFLLIRDEDGIYRILGMRGGSREGASAPFPNSFYGHRE